MFSVDDLTAKNIFCPASADIKAATMPTIFPFDL